MKITSEKSRQQPEFGGDRIGEIEPTGDKEQDFNKAMVALRDDNYEAFIDDLNTLAGDPKVKNLRDAIIDKFNSNDGVQVFFSNETAMPIKNIHPTQFEVDMEKSLSYPLQKKPDGIVNILSGEKPLKLAGLPLVVAEIKGTNYIIDGHHRWSQIYCLNPDAKMTVRILKSDMLQHPDDALKLVQMEIFVAKDGKKLPQSKVESGYNLYTIDENSFKTWCQNTMSDDAKKIFAKLLPEKDPTEYMWQNVETMRKEAEPTSNAHGREDMPQTDKVEGEFISPRAEKISESKLRKNTMKKLNITKERFEKSRYFQRKYGKLEYVSESGKLYKTDKGKVLMFNEGFLEDRLGMHDVELGREEPEPEWKKGEIVDIDAWQVMWEYDDEERLPEKGWKIVKVERDENYDDCDGYCYTIVNTRNPKLKVEVSASALVERKPVKKSGRKFKESRKLAKESSGEVASPDNVQVDDILYCTSYYDFMISTFYKVIEKRGKSTLVLQRLKKNYAGSQSDGVAEPTDEIDPNCKPITVRYGKRGFKVGSNRLYVWDGTPLEEFNYSESRKFGKKFTKESIGADPALICPYCGGDNCEISIGSDDLNFTNLDRLQGETFNVECWCNDCNKPYNVTVELNVKDVYPNEDADGLSGDWA